MFNNLLGRVWVNQTRVCAQILTLNKNVISADKYYSLAVRQISKGSAREKQALYDFFSSVAEAEWIYSRVVLSENPSSLEKKWIFPDSGSAIVPDLKWLNSKFIGESLVSAVTMLFVVNHKVDLSSRDNLKMFLKEVERLCLETDFVKSLMNLNEAGVAALEGVPHASIVC